MVELVAVLADAHPAGERGPVLALPQRAEVVGNALGQHGHDAVGEIDRIAAIQRLAVERGCRAAHKRLTSAMATVTTKPSGLSRGVVRLGENRVVMVLGVGRVDGDERDASASPRARKPSASMRAGLAASEASMVSGRNRSGIEWVLMAMRLIAFSLFIEPSRSRTLATGRPSAPARKGFDADEIAVAGLAAIGLGDAEFLVAHLLVHRHDAAAAGARVFAEHAEDALGGARQQLDHAAGIGRAAGLAQRRDAHQRAVADARRRRPADARLCSARKSRCAAAARAPRPIRRARRSGRRRGRAR